MTTLEQLFSLNKLNKATFECTEQSRWKESTQRYIINMLVNNIDIMDDVVGQRYAVRPTIDFTLNERGRLRNIEAPVIRDRNVQKILTKFVLIPSLCPSLIYDNYASLKLRGTSFARKRFEVMLRRYYMENGLEGYILLIDIKKYFESIDHDVLKAIIAPKIKNESKEVQDLINYIIDISSHSSKGLNLGSEAPQIFAIYYLGIIDTFIKIVKGVKYYGRYMDDIFIIGKTKEELQELLAEINVQLEALKLRVNTKKTHIIKLSHGFTFLQVKYNILPSGKVLKRMTRGKIVRERRRLKSFKRMYDGGKMSEEEVWNCYQSWRGTIVKDHNACTNTLRAMDKLYDSMFPKHQPHVKEKRSELTKKINNGADTDDLFAVTSLLAEFLTDKYLVI